MKKVLIANRGEIAIRVMKTCRRLGIATVAIYSQDDKNSLHAQLADEAYLIADSSTQQAYLNMEGILEIAHSAGADAIHPGYGFLSENFEFASKVKDAGLIFIGPNAETIKQMGLKHNAKELARFADVPVIPGFDGENQDLKHLLSEAKKIGFPLLVKASAGGGGKGMLIVRSREELSAAIERAKREAQSAFGNDHLILERYFEKAKHIEIQVMGDAFGNVVHLFERECSLQRRHQKIIEEAPSPSISDETRSQMCQAAVSLARKVNYLGAGTVEFIYDVESQEFFFLEMNTRLQVEHPVTEMIVGLDLVEMQLKVARGEELEFKQDDIHMRGHAIEARIYAEDPEQSFRPSPGDVYFFMPPESLRCDHGLKESDDKISHQYDPMVAKLISFASTREGAIKKLRQGLRETRYFGPSNNILFLIDLLGAKEYRNASFTTDFVERVFGNWSQGGADRIEKIAAWCFFISEKAATSTIRPGFRNVRSKGVEEVFQFGDSEVAVSYSYLRERRLQVDQQLFELESFEKSGRHFYALRFKNSQGKTLKAQVAQRDHHLFVNLGDGPSLFELKPKLPSVSLSQAGGGYASPMPGKISKVLVSAGQKVTKGQSLLILEAMKMENEIKALEDCQVEEVLVSGDEQVEMGKILIRMKES